MSRSTSRPNTPVNKEEFENEFKSVKKQLSAQLEDMQNEIKRVFQEEREKLQMERDVLFDEMRERRGRSKRKDRKREEEESSERSSTETDEERRASRESSRNSEYRNARKSSLAKTKTKVNLLEVGVEQNSGGNRTFLDALRFSSMLCKAGPNSQNVESWLSTFWDSISSTFPGLKEDEKCKICVQRFPQEIGERLMSSKLSTKEDLFKCAITLISPGEHNIEACRARFYSAQPQKGATLIGFINKLANLALSLELTQAQREYAIIKRVISFFPPYYRATVNTQLETLSKLGDEISVIKGLEDIFSNPTAVSEIEKGFAQISKVMHVVTKDEGKTTTHGASQKEYRRCMRCGSRKHKTNVCPIYQTESQEMCKACFDVFDTIIII